MTFAFIARRRGIWPVAWRCDVPGVSRSGSHAWLSRPPSDRPLQDAKLVAAIERSFNASDRPCGARRIWRDGLEEGLACGLHRIERLMRLNAMRARPKRRGSPRDDGERSVIGGNILARNIDAPGPNRKWLADFTCIWTAEGWLYVAVVLDARRENASPDRFLVRRALAPRGRLVDEGGSGRLRGHGRADDGGLAARKGRCVARILPTRDPNTPATRSSACCSTTASPAR